MRSAIIINIIILFLSSTFCWACSCAISENAVQEMNIRDAVFLGEVTVVKEVENWSAETTFKVKNVYKGEIEEFVTLRHGLPSPSCGISFEPGETYLVFAYNESDYLSTNKCTLTKKISEATKEIEQIEKQ